MNQSTDTLKAAGLDATLVAKMERIAEMTSVPCPMCKVGRGKMCIDLVDTGIPTYDGFHIQRTILAEADDLQRAAYGF